MALSNYPPGVSGLEPQIAGPALEREGIREVGECRNYGKTVHISTAEHAQTATVCTFTGGDADGVYEGDDFVATFWWYCPSCGTDNDVPDIDVSEEFAPDCLDD